MFKRLASSNKKLISKSAYAIAFVFPFISLFGETKASKIVSSEDQFFVQKNQSKSLHFTQQLNHNKFNLNFDDLDLLLVDFKLEFGFNSLGKIVIADEISPDNCRFWDKTNSDPKGRILDKDRFRQDLGGVIDAYGEILKRIERDSSNSS